ncbi:MAG: DNA-binding protein [Haloarculaceae archaeon]
MSDAPDEDELEKLRREKMEELQEQQGGEEAEAARQAQQEQAEAQKQALLRQHLTDEARKRLNTIRMSKPDFAEQVERQLVALAQSGRLQQKIDDEKMRQLLSEMKPDSQSFDIKHR